MYSSYSGLANPFAGKGGHDQARHGESLQARAATRASAVAKSATKNTMFRPGLPAFKEGIQSAPPTGDALKP
jgi:hypothetical protein